MVRVLEFHPSSRIGQIFDELEVRFHGCPEKKWDERTFYITVSLHYNGEAQVCDLIYLVDRDDFTAGFSLNKNYQKVRSFILKHFRHNLLYTDEMYFAKEIARTPEFESYLEKFAKAFPKYISTFKSTL